MNYVFSLNNIVLTKIHADNSNIALNFFKKLPKYRNLSLTEKCSVRINRASHSWGALLQIRQT